MHVGPELVGGERPEPEAVVVRQDLPQRLSVRKRRRGGGRRRRGHRVASTSHEAAEAGRRRVHLEPGDFWRGYTISCAVENTSCKII